MEWALTGLEFACGIPGTLGGAVIMNAGAWGSDMASIVRSVRLMTAEGEKVIARRGTGFFLSMLAWVCCVSGKGGGYRG